MFSLCLTLLIAVCSVWVGTAGSAWSASNSGGASSTLVLGTLPRTIPRISEAVVILDDGAVTARVDSNFAWAFYNVAPGVHSIRVEHPDYIFNQAQVTVSPAGSVTTHTIAYPGAPAQVSKLPVELIAVSQPVYDQVVPSPSIFAMLKSPTVLIVLVMGGMAFFGPKLMQNMDPEMMEEMKKQQKAMGGGDLSSMLSNFMSGIDAPQGGSSQGEPRKAVRARRR